MREVTRDVVIASVTQSEMNPDSLGPGVAALKQKLQLFKEEMA